MKIRKFTLALLFAITASACTQNQCARSHGGTMTINLPAGQKFHSATWKGESVWYVVRPAREGETPETFTFKENSSMGILEGSVVFVEKAGK